MKCLECDSAGFIDEEELEDVEIYRHDGGLIYKIERYSAEYDLDLSVMAAAFGYCFDRYEESWMLCPYCDGKGRE